MAERPKLLYIVVQDEEGMASENEVKVPSPRYTRPLLQSTLQLMGCKPRHAFKISGLVFEVIRQEMPPKKLKSHHSIGLAPLADFTKKDDTEADGVTEKRSNADVSGLNMKPLKKRSMVSVDREKFLDVVCNALAKYQYLGPKQRADLMIACRIRERKTSMTVLLCGTSGCGKSTLASLLASRLGVTTVVSTDSVRHMMRGFVSDKENPLLWASTYHAGECLDLELVAEAKAKKKEAKQASLPLHTSSGGSNGTLTTAQSLTNNRGNGSDTDEKGMNVSLEKQPNLRPDGRVRLEHMESLVGTKTMAVEGFKAQSEMVMDSLDRLITAWEGKKESVVVEGVHLSLNFVMGLMKKHPSIIPFMVYISNEDKHLERFAVRAKYMTLDPTRNKYVKYIRNIRTIQEYLCKRADKHLVPKVNNTNVDKSVAAIHATVFSCMRRLEDGEVLLDQATNTVKVLHQEYKNQHTSSALGSKGMFQLIQRRGSSRNLMALMNDDGSVAKAWPLLSHQVDRKPVAGAFGDSRPLYGPLTVGKAEPVNLQFGNLGLSAFYSEKGDTSGNGSNSSLNGQEDGSRLEHASSSASTIMPGDGSEKELKEEVEVSGSEEEVEDGMEGADSDEENSDAELEPVEENYMEGSVDEESARSDEGDVDYMDEIDHDDGYWSYDMDEVTPPTVLPADHIGADLGKGKPTLSRLRSFDQAVVGRALPQLRRCVSHMPYKKESIPLRGIPDDAKLWSLLDSLGFKCGVAVERLIFGGFLVAARKWWKGVLSTSSKGVQLIEEVDVHMDADK